MRTGESYSVYEPMPGLACRFVATDGAGIDHSESEHITCAVRPVAGCNGQVGSRGDLCGLYSVH